jgi:sigma-B regulation protein RsbU (phosphoserine phosphatase)
MGGDFFDYWFLEEDLLTMVMADVSGKGVPAAMFMAVARTTLRNCAVAGRTPGETLALANRSLAAENSGDMFVTVFYAQYHPRTGELVFANGGHNPPYIVRSDQRIESLGPSTGPMLGTWADAGFDNDRSQLEPGDLLVLYTDGVTEAWNERGAMFGTAGLTRVLEHVRDRPVDEICQAIIREVNQYRRSEGQDDVTLLVLRRNC